MIHILYLPCYFRNFLEHTLTLMRSPPPHLIKDCIARYTHSAPSERPYLEDHSEWIPYEPVHPADSITSTENPCFFAREEFLGKHLSFLILIGKTSCKNTIKKVLENSGHIDPPNREDKNELICSGDFCLESETSRTQLFHI